MRISYARLRISALFLVSLLGPGACSDTTDPVGADSGAVSVEVATTGFSRDLDGYDLSVDGGSGPAIQPDARTTLSGLTPGDHVIELLGVSVNCHVAGGNPRTVAVVGGQTSTVSFSVVCEQASGSIRVSTRTLGVTPDTDGYDLLVDGTPARSLGSSAVATIEALEPGSHGLELDGVAANCEIGGGAIREVTVYADVVSAVSFDVQCTLVAREIAFVSDRIVGPGGGEVFLVDSDGGNLTRLTADGEWDIQPAWAPGGNAIAFAREGGWFDFDVFALGRDVGLRRVTSSGHAERPTWSPDGTRIAYSDDFGGDAELYVVTADGSGRTRLTTELGFDGEPAWSPDGTRLAFTSERDGNAEIYLVDADGSNPTNLTSDPAQDYDPVWAW